MKLPKMKCDRCGECCGPCACTPAEYEAISHYTAVRGIKPIRQGVTCPWFNKSCQVYAVRPYICRLFGHTADLQCGNGHNRNISRGSEARLAHYMPTHAAFRWLHEACFTSEEFLTIMEAYGRENMGQPDAKIDVELSPSQKGSPP